MAKPFIAVDWGTTNRRAFLIEGGAVSRVEREPRGASALTPADYPAELAALRDRLGNWPVLMAGMVGSTIGWQTVPYRPLPVDMAALAQGILRVDDHTAIVPGLSQADPADVMRGEEVQLLGAHAAGLVPADALLCQPGTHCKWATLRGGTLVAFSTAMTGELFALARKHSILSSMLDGPVADGPSFRAGVADGVERGVATGLFGVRARALLHGAADGAAYASGVLIGADVAPHVRSGPIHILADEALGSLYRAAAEALGGQAVLVDSEAAFVAGMNRLWELAS